MMNTKQIVDSYVHDQLYTLVDEGPYRLTFLKGEYGLLESVDRRDETSRTTIHFDANGRMVGREVVVYLTDWIQEQAKAYN